MEKQEPTTQVYRILKSLRRLAWVVGGPLVVCSAGLIVLPLLALIITRKFEASMVFFPVMGSVVGFFSLQGLLFITRKQIILEEDAMISRGIFRRRRLPYEDIKGYRTDGQDCVIFVPKTAGAKVMRFSRFMEGHASVMADAKKNFEYLDLEEAGTSYDPLFIDPSTGEKVNRPGFAGEVSKTGKVYLLQSNKPLIRLTWIAASIVMGGALLLGISPFIWVDEKYQDVHIISFPIAAFVFFNLGFWTLLFIYRNKVIIDSEKIIHIGMFRRRKMYFKDIRGFRIEMTDIYPTVGFLAGSMILRSSKYFSRPVQFIHFIPNRPGVKEMKVETYFAGTRALLTWAENKFACLDEPSDNGNEYTGNQDVNYDYYSTVDVAKSEGAK